MSTTLLITATALAVGAGAIAWRRRHVVSVVEHEAALVALPGRATRLLGPGRHVLWNPLAELTFFDLRSTPMALTGQEVLTADGATVRLSIAGRFKVTDPLAAFSTSTAWRDELHNAVQLALREIVAKSRLDSLLEDRGALEAPLLERARELLTVSGVELLSARLRDLSVTGDLKRALAEVQVARAEGAARLERARAESASLRSLANAARLLKENEALLDLRVLSTVEAAANSSGSLTLDLSAWKRSKPPTDDNSAA